MIQLTRLNGNPLTVNCDLIKYAEATPDTTLTLLTGEKIVVRESCAEVTAKAVHYRALVLGDLGRSQLGSAEGALATRTVTNVAAAAALDPAHSRP